MFHCRWSKLEMRKPSNSSEIETNYAFSDGLVILDGNGRFWCPDALFNGMEFMRQQNEFQQKVLSRDDLILQPERKYSIWIEGYLCFSFKLKQISLFHSTK